MSVILLQQMLDNLPAGGLPPNWRSFDFESFSREKSLWDYQQAALAYAQKALWRYYGQPGLTSAQRKADFYRWYLDFGLDQNLDIPLDKSSAAKRQLAALQETYYDAVDEKLSYAQFINSICFWMATGSGKTLVIVKLVELLHELIKRGEIPNNDILILAHRDDLLAQLQEHISDYNTTGGFYIDLQELRDSPLADGQNRIYTHGEKEALAVEEQMKKGIPVNHNTMSELIDLCKYLGIDPASYFGDYTLPEGQGRLRPNY